MVNKRKLGQLHPQLGPPFFYPTFPKGFTRQLCLHVQAPGSPAAADFLLLPIPRCSLLPEPHLPSEASAAPARL